MDFLTTEFSVGLTNFNKEEANWNRTRKCVREDLCRYFDSRPIFPEWLLVIIHLTLNGFSSEKSRPAKNCESI